MPTLQDLIDQAEQSREDIKELQDALKRETVERERLAVQHEMLDKRFRYPGGKFLNDLQYKAVYYTGPTALSVPVGMSAGPLVDTLPGTIHGLYVLSAFDAAVNVGVFCDGVMTAAQNDLNTINAVVVTLRRGFFTAPDRIEVNLAFNNFNNAAVTLAIKVWRHLGIGSGT